MPKTALDARRAPMYHDEMTASAAPTMGSPKDRNELAVADTWKLDDIYAERRRSGRRAAPALEAGIQRPGGPARHAGLGRGGAAGRASRSATRSASSPTASTTTPPSTTTRTSATTPPTAAASGSSTCWRSGARRRRGSTRSCWRSRSRPCRAGWRESEALAVYRFAIEDLYRQQAHVLDAAGERLLALSAQFGNAADDSYDALATADAKFPTITLSTGEEVQATYARYRAILATNRVQADRAKAFAAHHQPFADHQNTYAVALQRRAAARLVPHPGPRLRDHARGRPRRQRHPDVGRREPDRRPAAPASSRCAATSGCASASSASTSYHLYDGTIPLVEFDRRYPYHDVTDWIVESTAVLGADYQARVRRAFAERWIDVYENPGKHSGAYSASVYGVHPYMLLNWNDTLDSVFTLAHEMGHSMHTMLAHETQPFVYSSYTIFVAEVPSTLSEALLLDYMLARATDPRERVVLLQHAIDEVTSTFYRQVLFANYELEAHRMVERGEPITAGQPEHALSRPAHRLLRRHPGRRRAAQDHLGAHPALLRLALLRLPVRDLLRLERAAAAGRAGDRSGAAGRRRPPLPRSAARRQQGSPDGAAAGGRRRPGPARDGRRHRQPPRRPRQPARDRARRASVCCRADAMTRKPAVLITGANGEIGHGLITALAAEGDPADRHDRPDAARSVADAAASPASSPDRSSTRACSSG